MFHPDDPRRKDQALTNQQINSLSQYQAVEPTHVWGESPAYQVMEARISELEGILDGIGAILSRPYDSPKTIASMVAQLKEQHSMVCNALLDEDKLTRQARERVYELKLALESIRQYGSDTLSGPMHGRDDREWQRSAVLEMTQRANRAINPE